MEYGKKISIDSATLINKVFEIIEAKKIFNIPIDKFEISNSSTLICPCDSQI